MKKHETTLMIKADRNPSGFTEVLENLFYKQPSLASEAISLLLEIKESQLEKQLYPTSNWQEFCETHFGNHLEDKEKASIEENEKSLIRARGKYYSIIRKLRGAGLIYERNRCWYLGAHFEEHLRFNAQLYENWKAKE